MAARSDILSSVPRSAPRLVAGALLGLVLAGCTMTTMARPGAGRLTQVEVGGQSYLVRVIPDLRSRTHWTRIIAATPEEAMRVHSQICDGRPYAKADWPDGRLFRDNATGEWAVEGDCPGLLAAGI